jgi:hypothetical protein
MLRYWRNCKKEHCRSLSWFTCTDLLDTNSAVGSSGHSGNSSHIVSAIFSTVQCTLYHLEIRTGSVPIWIRSGSGFSGIPRSVSGSGSRFQRTKLAQENRKQFITFIFWSSGCSFLRAEGFSCSFHVLYEGLGKVNCNFWSNKEKKKISAEFLFQFLFIKTLDPYPDPDSLEMPDPDPDPDSMNPDPQNCSEILYSTCWLEAEFMNVQIS